MKKIFKSICSVVLATVLITGIVFSTFSIQTLASNGEGVITLDVVWEDVSFTYDVGTATWNPLNHNYETDGSSAEWTDGVGKITVINYSSVSMLVDIAFNVAENPNGTAVLTVDKPSFVLQRGDLTAQENAPRDFTTVSASGVPKDGSSLGKITVTVSMNENAYEREENTVYFGEYPQTLKASSVTVGTTADSRGYFLGSDNEYYAKVTASPYESGYKFSTDAAVTSGSVYYFKVEPLKWRILSENNGNALLICESIIANGRYDDASNDYGASEIRSWLNGQFYNIAFDNIEKSFIESVTLENGLTDNVYLPSFAEASTLNQELRVKSVSDYARASGAWVSTSYLTAQNGNGLWMLRTPNGTYSHFIGECNHIGDLSDGGTNLASKFYGIVPALTIKL